MAENRRAILSALKTLLESVTGVTTVVRSYGELDVAQYQASDLPLIEIEEPSESTDEDSTGRRAIMLLEAKLKVWFVDWNDIPQSTYETLMKNIRDDVGSGFTVSGSAVACWITVVSPIKGELPVFNFEMSLRLKYYLNQLNT